MKFIFGAVLFIIGVIGISTNIFSMVLCGIAAFFFHTDGIEIDLDKKKYRNIISFFSLDFGKWKDLPQIEYTSVFKTSETTTIRALSAEANVKNDIVKVNLFYDSNRRIEAYKTYSVDDAFEKAKQIATILNVDILDATERESKWL